MKLINEFLKLPEILNKELSPEGATDLIIKTFEEDLGFDFVLVGYLNSDGTDIKGMTEPNKRVKFVQQNSVGKEFSNFIKNKKPLSVSVLKNRQSILYEMGIELTESASVVLLPLNIKGAVFGVIAGIKFSGKIWISLTLKKNLI